MKISVIGTGYVGLVTGACLAESGNDVVNADIDDEKISMLNHGNIPIFEPGLEEVVDRNVREKRLSFTTDVEAAIHFADAIFIAVGTPPSPSGAADTTHVFNVAKKIAQTAESPKIVATKSTVPIGTGKQIQAILDEEGHTELLAVSNPEFLREGSAIRDFNDPDRIVIGANNRHAYSVMRDIFDPIAHAAASKRATILEMDIASAEMTKYAANGMLATRISFMNELARLCSEVGANIDQVREGIGLDPRIGKRFLNPGIGYGGSCFPKDVLALISTGNHHGVEMQILQSVHGVNESQKQILAEMILDYYGRNLEGKTLAVWGLAFKPNTDDMRDAPSVVIINKLLAAGARIRAFDPIAMPTAKRILGDRIDYAASNYDVLQGADALLILTEWPEFSHPDTARMKDLMKAPVLFDGRNIYQPERTKHAGFTYFSIGRPPVLPGNGS